MTNREIALEAASRFTDRHKFTVDTMLRNAEKIEEWLNRDVAPSENFIPDDRRFPIESLENKMIG